MARTRKSWDDRNPRWRVCRKCGATAPHGVNTCGNCRQIAADKAATAAGK